MNMQLFWQEYAFFIVAVFGIGVCFSIASLFVVVYRYEKLLETIWRAVGFISLGIAFFLFILERKYPVFGFPALVVQLFAFYSIYRGVWEEPTLSHLEKGPGAEERGRNPLRDASKWIRSPWKR